MINFLTIYLAIMLTKGEKKNRTIEEICSHQKLLLHKFGAPILYSLTIFTYYMISEC